MSIPAFCKAVEKAKPIPNSTRQFKWSDGGFHEILPTSELTQEMLDYIYRDLVRLGRGIAL